MATRSQFSVHFWKRPFSQLQKQQNMENSTNKSPSSRFSQQEPSASYHYDYDYDLQILKKILRSDLEESGYQSALTRSQSSQYGTGWLYHDSESIASTSSCDDWDGYMKVDNQRVKIREVSDLLVTRYAFISGAKTDQGFPVLTFPDSHVHLPFVEYRLLITYLTRLQPYEQVEDIFLGFVVIIDRRTDRWASVKTLLSHLSSFFPGNLRFVYVIKPDGVLQRALEVGYKHISGVNRLQTFVCNSLPELHQHINPSCLTYDLCGSFHYNHLEWLQHRMEIERLRCSAEGIARTLDEFVQNLRETELPNDASTTANILSSQKADRDAIKEDFRIIVRRGFDLLKSVRQADTKPNAEQLSPTRVHNVTSVQRTLLQLEDTEKRFDKFWPTHEFRLQHCLQLRQFEEDFKKLQSNFLCHLEKLRIGPHFETGERDQCRLCSIDEVDRLIEEYRIYAEKTQADVQAANSLKLRGEQLIAAEEKELIGSLTPKCQELQRLTEQLDQALKNRSRFLHDVKKLHDYICQANHWCNTGVQLMINMTMELDDIRQCEESLFSIQNLLSSSNDLTLDLDTSDSLLLLSAYDTKTLLSQVNARVSDVKQLCESRCVFLKRLLSKARISSFSEPIKMTAAKATNPLSCTYRYLPLRESSHTDIGQLSDDASDDALAMLSPPPGSLWSELPYDQQANVDNNSCTFNAESSKRSSFVLNELLSTEQNYVDELRSVVKYYIHAFEDADQRRHVPNNLLSKQKVLFGNLHQIYNFHSEIFLPALKGAESNVRNIARTFLDHTDHFQIYITYCLNKPLSEALLKQCPEGYSFLQVNNFCIPPTNHGCGSMCQDRAGHALPLSAYLLKPVQRVTKYQLLLKELARSVDRTEGSDQVEQALNAILELLHLVNASLNQGYIVGYTGDLSSLGAVLLEGRFRVWLNKKTGDKAPLRMRRASKVRQRHVFLYSTVMLMCKCRRNSIPHIDECYEVKEELPIDMIENVEVIKTTSNSSSTAQQEKFQIITENKQEVLTFQSINTNINAFQFVAKLKHLLSISDDSTDGRMRRPISWTSHSSNEAGYCNLDRKRHSESDLLVSDSNNNPSTCLGSARSELNLLSSVGGTAAAVADEENNKTQNPAARGTRNRDRWNVVSRTEYRTATGSFPFLRSELSAGEQANRQATNQPTIVSERQQRTERLVECGASSLGYTASRF
ncbi:Guanine nucleotide exchange factor DBS [Trichinella nelsoni]|uniref:Guanine nucleotide exchange factor DBS n=1 Tax=Trichinella nelsoni TaxID=6336 RepID=A0A0V0RGR2_9BILA|nr:Guanine nucleotide exchange factor DBS [Trichinella nelsoni]